jgi:hypothetical protein
MTKIHIKMKRPDGRPKILMKAHVFIKKKKEEE